MNKINTIIKNSKSVQAKEMLIRESDNKIYVNVSLLPQSNVITTNSLEPMEYRVERNYAILENPSDYYCTIARFRVPALDVPIIICPIQEGQANPNLTPYSITMSYGGNDYQRYIQYVTETPNDPAPSTADPIQIVNNFYYYVYTYQHMVKLINTTLLNVFADLVAGEGNLQPPKIAPTLVYDQDSERFSIICQYEYSITNTVEVWINDELLSLLNNFPGQFYGRNEPNEKDFQLELSYNNNAHVRYGQTQPATTIPPALPANPYYIKVEEDYSGVSNWNSFVDIVFTTNSLPIRKEWTQTNTSQGLPVFRSILTDFQPILNEAGDIRSVLAYYPQGPYRLIDMTGTTPLRMFDFKVFWRDKKGRIFPMYIPYGQEMSIKFLFLKKSTFTS